MMSVRMNWLTHMPAKYTISQRWCPPKNASQRHSLDSAKRKWSDVNYHRSPRCTQLVKRRPYCHVFPVVPTKRYEGVQLMMIDDIPWLPITQNKSIYNSIFTPFQNFMNYLKYVVKIRMWTCLGKFYERAFAHLPILFLYLIQFTQDSTYQLVHQAG